MGASKLNLPRICWIADGVALTALRYHAALRVTLHACEEEELWWMLNIYRIGMEGNDSK